MPSYAYLSSIFIGFLYGSGYQRASNTVITEFYGVACPFCISQKEFGAVLLPESVSPVLNIPKMIFLKEPTYLFPNFVRVHNPHSTVMHLPLCEGED